ncbi:MAG: four helix bundle protein [Verrucomicrobiota bacterium]
MKDLETRTKEFALRIIKLSAFLNGSSKEAAILSRQILRSGTSIGANYRETKRARSKAEFISTMGICLKEAEEVKYWLELLEEAELVTNQQINPLKMEINELISILVTSIKTAKKHGKE